jgi:hypothetical protein
MGSNAKHTAFWMALDKCLQHEYIMPSLKVIGTPLDP